MAQLVDGNPARTPGETVILRHVHHSMNPRLKAQKSKAGKVLSAKGCHYEVQFGTEAFIIRNRWLSEAGNVPTSIVQKFGVLRGFRAISGGLTKQQMKLVIGWLSQNEFFNEVISEGGK